MYARSERGNSYNLLLELDPWDNVLKAQSGQHRTRKGCNCETCPPDLIDSIATTGYCLQLLTITKNKFYPRNF